MHTLVPSSILHFEQVPSEVRTLLEQSRSYRERFQWRQAESRARYAQDICRHACSQPGLAAARLHLADVL